MPYHLGYDYKIDSPNRGGSVASSPLLTGLVSYWKLEEASGNRVDQKATNDLAPTNAPGNQAGKIGNALALVAASNQFVSVADNGTLESLTAFTCAIWFNTSAAVQQALVNKGNAGGQDYTLDMLAGGNIRMGYNSFGTTLTTAGTFNNGAWHLAIFGLRTGNTIFLRLDNGVEQTTASGAGLLNNLPFSLGCYASGSGNYNGGLDEAGWWNIDIGATLQSTLWNGGAGITYPF